MQYTTIRVYCCCGYTNAVQNAKLDDKVQVFCVGCGHTLKYQPRDNRRGSVAVSSLSLRDFKFPGSGIEVASAQK